MSYMCYYTKGSGRISLLDNSVAYGSSLGPNEVPSWCQASCVLSQPENPQTGQMVGWDTWSCLKVSGALVLEICRGILQWCQWKAELDSILLLKYCVSWGVAHTTKLFQWFLGRKCHLCWFLGELVLAGLEGPSLLEKCCGMDEAASSLSRDMRQSRVWAGSTPGVSLSGHCL